METTTILDNSPNMYKVDDFEQFTTLNLNDLIEIN